MPASSRAGGEGHRRRRRIRRRSSPVAVAVAVVVVVIDVVVMTTSIVACCAISFFASFGSNSHHQLLAGVVFVDAASSGSGRGVGGTRITTGLGSSRVSRDHNRDHNRHLRRRQDDEGDKLKNDVNDDDIDDDYDNPMLGRIWVRRNRFRHRIIGDETANDDVGGCSTSSTSSSSLIFKFADSDVASFADDDDNDDNDEIHGKRIGRDETCVELYESPHPPGEEGNGRMIRARYHYEDGGSCSRSNCRRKLDIKEKENDKEKEEEVDGDGIGDQGRREEDGQQQERSSSKSSLSSSSSSYDHYVPIEGIYGVYHLPHSGPHVVLITESEGVYKSPTAFAKTTMKTMMSSSSSKSMSSPRSSSTIDVDGVARVVVDGDDNDRHSSRDIRPRRYGHGHDRGNIPLLELRRIVSLEIVSLRDDDADCDDGLLRRRRRRRSAHGGGNEIRQTSSSSRLHSEEVRQLRLLRKSFREHDLYFTVPRQCYFHNDNVIDSDDDDDDIIVVPDVTHTMQRTFTEFSKVSMSSTTITATAGNNHRHRWWMNYVTKQVNLLDDNKEKEKDHSTTIMTPSSLVVGRVPATPWRDGGGGGDDSDDDALCVAMAESEFDRRFFWNESPALSMLPPSPESSSSLLMSSSSSLTSSSSPYFCLLDRVIPVTSAFVGVQCGVAIPPSSSSISADKNSIVSETRIERYDQILISRRSKFRAGTRFTRRGVDDAGNVANYAETEQICFIVSGLDDDVDDETGDREESHTGDDRVGDSDCNSATITHNSNHSARVLEVYSHVQTRGSIPLHWSSPVVSVMEYRPRVYIGVDPISQARGLRDHLLGELRRYSSSFYSSTKSPATHHSSSEMKKTSTKIAMVNLIDKHSDQGRLGRAFDSVFNAVLDVYDNDYGPTLSPTLGHGIELRRDLIEHVWFDFHAECKGGRYDRLSQLLELVVPRLNDQGYFGAVLSGSTKKKSEIEASSNSKHPHQDNNAMHSRPSWKILSLQDGVVRTNCMDCLDRTNVVQSMFGRFMIYKQIHERIGRFSQRRRTLPLECVVAYKRRPMTLPWMDGEESHRYLWADNADAISRLYAGTPALKGDFTRTGKRTRRGALDDGVNSLQRYYLNNFIDADRQEGIDLLVGDAEFNGDDILPTSLSAKDDGIDGVLTSDESSRSLTHHELAQRTRKRRGYDQTHARIKVESGESFGGSITSNHSKDRQRHELKANSFIGNVRHHANTIALLSRSLLGQTTREEHRDATTSAEFLLRVTSAAAEGSEIRPLLDDNAPDPPISSSDRKRSLEVRPWWALSSLGRDDDESGRDECTGDHVVAKTILGGDSIRVHGKRAVAILLFLLARAPLLLAGLIAVAVASGFSTSIDHEDPSSD